MLIQRTHKFCVYPTAGQRRKLAVEFGNARYVWNRALELRGTAWEADNTRHNYVSLNRMVAGWKRSDAPWLADSAACCLTQTLIDQDGAFKNFFEKRGKYPRFKSRHDRQAVRYQLDWRQIDRIYKAGEFLKLPKLGPLKIRWNQIPVGTPKMATVSKAPDGRYFASFACEIEIAPSPMTGKVIGVDLGIKDVAVSWDGEKDTKSGNP